MLGGDSIQLYGDKYELRNGYEYKEKKNKTYKCDLNIDYFTDLDQMVNIFTYKIVHTTCLDQINIVLLLLLLVISGFLYCLLAWQYYVLCRCNMYGLAQIGFLIFSNVFLFTKMVYFIL